MGIRRTEMSFEHSFAQIPNEWLRDERLSRRARGLLAEIMTHRAGWHISIRTLSKTGPEGRDAIATAVNELLRAGYLRRVQDREEGGRFGEVEYELTENRGVGFSGSGVPADPRVSGDVTVAGFPVSGGSTVSGLAVSGLAVSGESATKNTSTSEDHQVEDQLAPKRRKSEGPLPEIWSPNAGAREYAATNGVDVDHEAGQFRAHARANDRRQRDWDMAFRQWLGNAVKWAKPKGLTPGVPDYAPDQEWMYRG